MAASIRFDSLKFVKKLTQVGIPQNQAEAQAEAFKEAHEENLDCLATQQDIKEVKLEIRDVKQELKQEIQGVKQELKQEIQEVKQELKQEIQEVKQEIQGVRQELKQEIQEVRQEIKEVKHELGELRQEFRFEIDLKCSELKTDLIKWVLSIVFTVSAAQSAVIISMMKFFH